MSVECRSGLVELIADVIGLVDVRLARPCRLRTLERVHAQLHASGNTVYTLRGLVVEITIIKLVLSILLQKLDQTLFITQCNHSHYYLAPHCLYRTLYTIY